MPEHITTIQKPVITTLDISLGGDTLLTFTRDRDGKVVAILHDDFTYDDAAYTFVEALKPYLEALD